MHAAPRFTRTYGPALNGTLSSNEIIIQSHVGNRIIYAWADRTNEVPARPLERDTLPASNATTSTIHRICSDSTLTTARYLFSNGTNLRYLS
ncbi:membrane protein [Mycobacterium lepromatosis]|uniref:hypothetical protein n=1 Tax=Mycobacterium lepromatosis TaxID=480418 RepID=UPI0006788093|nr:hypothetical protein [Mycobacterium lepromatosis]UKN42229.1 membrane protein [Mycobacterium lepromatosis]